MMRLLVLALCAAAGPALAQDGPLTTPTRDVDVMYRSTTGSRTVEQRSRYRAADGKLRLDTPSPGLWMIVDPHAHTVAMVSDGDRGVVDMRLRGPVGPGGFAAGQAFTRQRETTVAGLACTEWQAVDRQGEAVVACFTADGILLRARRAGTVLVQAVRVSYGPLDPAAFTIPLGYAHSAAPERRP
jgi:hypothetical protein